MVVPLSLDLRSPADEEDVTRAVAVFREDYGRPNLLVGRDPSPGAQMPLTSFSAANLLSAVVIDPIVDQVFNRTSETAGSDELGPNELVEVPQPALREEYTSLGVWLLPEEQH